jgi:heat shock protein HslJ
VRARLAVIAGAALSGACAMPWVKESTGPSQLAGTRWIGVAEGSANAASRPRLEFTANGRMAGFSGCNNMSSSFRESGGVVSFGQVAATKRFCGGLEGDIERRVLEAVTLGSAGEVKGGKLVVTGPAGARYDFERAPAN